MSQPYKYFAFISYSRRDSKTAAWLQRRLEWFRFPVKLVPVSRRPPDPKFVRPIYRDKTNLEVTDEHYWTNIRRALEDSRFLIVLCSAHSARSEPVNMEVAHFLSVHGGDTSRVLPVILSGSVLGVDEDAAMCAALRALGGELINRNLPTMVPDADTAEQDARESGFVSLSSYLLKVERAAIGDHIQRESRRQARNLRLWLLGVVALGMLALLAGWYAWGQKSRAESSERRTIAALEETRKQLEKSWLEGGRVWLERADAAHKTGDHSTALMHAGRAVGYQGYGRPSNETKDFTDAFPFLLGKPMLDPSVEKERVEEAAKAASIIASIRPTCLPLWATTMGAGVTCVAFSPDGTRLAGGATNKTIKIWDAASGRELFVLPGHKEMVTSLAFSPDGRRLASGCSDAIIQIWDTSTGKELDRLSGHTLLVTSLAFSPDGTCLASASLDNTIRLWTGTKDKKPISLEGHMPWVTSVSFSPDGMRLASGSGDKTIRIWDLPTGKVVHILQGHTDIVRGIAMSPDGTRVASCSDDKTIKVWNAITGKEIDTLPGHQGGVKSVAFSPDGMRLVSSSDDTAIKLWDLSLYQLSACLPRCPGAVVSVAFSPDGTRIVSGSSDTTIRLWDAAMGKELTSLQGHAKKVRSVSFSPDDTLIVSGSDDTDIKLWDTVTGIEAATLQGHKDTVVSAAFSLNGDNIASHSLDGTTKFWDAKTGKQLADALLDREAERQSMLRGHNRLSTDQRRVAEPDRHCVFVIPNPQPPLNLVAPLRAGLFSKITQSTLLLHMRQDTLARLTEPALTPSHRAELHMELCAKSRQFRAATALWQRLLQGEWPGFEGATVPKEAPATIPASSPIRRLYLLALIDATKHPQIHGHPTICQTAAQIAPVLTKEMMATPTISLAMMSLMQTLAKDENAAMNEPRAALMKKLGEVATKEWLAVLRE